MTTSTERMPKSLERRILQREILKYGGTLLATGNEFEQEEIVGCNKLTPQLATDATLTGFAQLAALRMKSKHGFISLIDDKFQHVVAEATRTISPFDLSVHDPDDGLIVGVQTLDLEFGICPITLAAFSKGSDHWIDTDITYADQQKYVISDLLAEPRVNKARFMEGNYTSRFYAEVPLRNSQGMIIGSVSVIDDAPRSNPAEVDVRALEDIALMTMDHFELVRIRQVSMRAERLMQGLGHFNLGKSSISHWVMNNSGQNVAVNGQPYGIPSDSPFSTPAFLDETPTPTPTPTQLDKDQPLATPSLAMERSGYFDVKPSKIIQAHAQHTKSSIPRSNGVNGTTSFPTAFTTNPPMIAQSRAPADIKDAFERASNLIRESMDLDATCFLEISPAAHLKSRERKDSIGSLDYSSSASSAPYSTRPGANSVASKYAPVYSAKDVSGKTLCSRLGFSARSGFGHDQSAYSIDFATFPETSLCKLAHEYSAGKLFNFDSFGAFSAEESSRQDAKGLLRRKKLANLMVQHFPHARSLIFMPLYDNETRNLYAGFFGWTTDPRRVLLDSEVVYVLGFANSIMCEVMRLETLAVEKAKTDFMSSMSHELRSPLHGILGATQLLQESDLPPAQQELATMIDSCGRTLLDIMNNLLEHAKINNITNAKRSSLRQGKDSAFDVVKKDSSATNDGTSALVNLASLVEETVTSVAAGHSVRQQRSEQVSERRLPQRAIDLDSLAENEVGSDGLPLPPAVITNIPHQDSWLFETEAGSWRRVVMNLVGNALKYTQRGHICVTIESSSEVISSKKATGGVVLTVEDTGQGISENYLRNRLYTPFAQEDTLSSGAGLGLSIVNRLVEALGGTIQMESEVDVGTKVTVSVPIFAVQKDHVSFIRSNSFIGFDALRHLVDGHEKFAFVGFDHNSDPEQPPSRQTLTPVRLKQSLLQYASSWFGMVPTNNLHQASVVLVEGVFARNLLSTDPTNPIFKKPYIVVNAHESSTSRRTDEWPGCCNFMAAPIGPVKLSRVLSASLQQDDTTVQRIDMATKRRHSAITTNNQGERPETKSLESPYKKVKTSIPSVDKGNCRILLVEDNSINLKLLASFIRRLGFPYTTATNGQEAVDEYTASFEEGTPIRYILMDITMPVMDGISATRHIRAFEKSKNIDPSAEIIALTGLGHVEAQAEAMASGVDQYFCKPVKLDQLKRLLIDTES